jgi:nucleotide-binding universal stress UspA family protein
MIENAKKELHQMVELEKVEGMEISEQVREGEPVEEVRSIVESRQIDLVIMLAHQEGRLEHFLFGKTNERIIRQLPATLMLVKTGSSS